MFNMIIPTKENELTVEEAVLRYAKIEQEFAKTIEQLVKSGNSAGLETQRERVKKSIRRDKLNPGQILQLMGDLERHGLDIKRYLQIRDLTHKMHHRMWEQLNAAINAAASINKPFNFFNVPSDKLDEYTSGGNI